MQYCQASPITAPKHKIEYMTVVITTNVSSDIVLKEFEWYLRDLFFRSNFNNRQKAIDCINREEIINTLLKNYLRYRNYDYDKISNLLNTVLANLHAENVIKFEKDANNVKLYSAFDRKQCRKCYYINYLSVNEKNQCSRCNSGEVQEFPSRKS
jgi:predicted Zn-ribbon and HTH transcriptional regulator